MIYNNNEIIKEQHTYRLMDYNPWDKLMIYIDNSKTKYMLKNRRYCYNIQETFIKYNYWNGICSFDEKIYEIVEILIYYSLKRLD